MNTKAIHAPLAPLDSLKIPDFKEFISHPNNPTCPVIDSTRLMVEVLGGLQKAPGEFADSEFSSKMLLDGDFSLVVRYKREKDGKYRPACAISFDVIDNGVHIKQIQGSNDKSVAFRLHSSFNTTAFFLKVIEESFIKKGIPVTVEQFPNGMENASYASKARERYQVFQTAVEGIKHRYAHE